MPRSAAVGRLTLLVNNANEFTSDEIGRLDRVNFDRQIAVGLRAPLFLAEAFAAQAPEGGIASAADFARQGSAVPLGHGPNPDEIAAAVLYLAGARSVTGETIAVDGGQHLSWQTADEAEIASLQKPAWQDGGSSSTVFAEQTFSSGRGRSCSPRRIRT